MYMSEIDFETAHGLWTPSDAIHDSLLRDGISAVITNSAPMGGGKSGVNREILNFVRPYDLQKYGRERTYSVSKTSRPPRPGERESVDYEFNVDPSFFVPAFEQGRMLEIDEHAGSYYGTPMPTPGNPLLVEIEVRGLKTATENNHPNAQWFRRNNIAIYIAQQNMLQLITQILERPDDTISEEKKMARVCRYPGELQYILDHRLSYNVVSNVAGVPQAAQQAALQVIARDPEAPILNIDEIDDLITEACDTLYEHRLEPVWL